MLARARRCAASAVVAARDRRRRAALAAVEIFERNIRSSDDDKNHDQSSFTRGMARLEAPGVSYSDDPRNGGRASFHEERLRGGLRADAAGGAHRSRRRSGQLLASSPGETLEIVAILLTHAHVDHVCGVARAKRQPERPDLSAPRRSVSLRAGRGHGLQFGLQVEAPPPVDVFYDGPGPLSFGDYDIFVHHTPGHCPGGVCLQIGRRGEPGLDLFVGDTLFAGVDRPHRSARRRLRDADAVDHARCCSPSATTPACIRAMARARRSATSAAPIRFCSSGSGRAEGASKAKAKGKRQKAKGRRRNSWKPGRSGSPLRASPV